MLTKYFEEHKEYVLKFLMNLGSDSFPYQLIVLIINLGNSPLVLFYVYSSGQVERS